jgi:hypothetical protein
LRRREGWREERCGGEAVKAHRLEVGAGAAGGGGGGGLPEHEAPVLAAGAHLRGVGWGGGGGRGLSFICTILAIVHASSARILASNCIAAALILALSAQARPCISAALVARQAGPALALPR